MPRSRLSELQERVLVLLAGVRPPWTLTGGPALSGFHLGHRATRDLDLFWHGRTELGPLTNEVVLPLSRAGLTVVPLQTFQSFARVLVRDAGDEVIVDLVADRVPTIEEPVRADLRDTSIQIDTPHEILVNKLCTLLSRKELRDLRDVRELLACGGDLDRALLDAKRKDGGFSPLMVAWILKGTALREMAPVGALSEAELDQLQRFRDQLVARLTRAAAPQ